MVGQKKVMVMVVEMVEGAVRAVGGLEVRAVVELMGMRVYLGVMGMEAGMGMGL
jgi:hypothetical protein